MADLAPLIRYGFEWSRVLDAEGESKRATNVRTALRALTNTVEMYSASESHHKDLVLFETLTDMSQTTAFLAKEIALARSRLGYNEAIRSWELSHEEWSKFISEL